MGMYQQQMDPELQKTLQRGENVLWTGRPNKRVVMLRTLPVMIIGLFFMAIPIGMFFMFMSFGAVFGDSGICFMAPILLFAAIGGLIAFGPLIYSYLNAKVTNYAITDRRVITKAGVIGTDFNFTEFDKIQNVTVDVGFWDKGAGTGSILMTLPGVSVVASSSRGSNVRANRHVLASIPDPYNVQNVLNDAIRAAGQAQQPRQSAPRSQPQQQAGYGQQKPRATGTGGPAQAGQAGESRFCRYCGTSIPTDSVFCSGCGKRV